MSGWRLALRVARREAWRHQGRSALVAAMIALPVAAAGMADTVWRSSQVTPAQSAVWDMGRYDAMITDQAEGPLTQTPNGTESAPDTTVAGVPAPGTAPAGDFGGADGATGSTTAGSGNGTSDIVTSDNGTSDNGTSNGASSGSTSADGTSGDGTTDGDSHDSAAALAAARALLPPGSSVSAPVSTSGEVMIAQGHGRVWAGIRALDLADPLTHGMFPAKGGTAPHGPGQAAVSEHLAKSLGKGIGDTVVVTVPSDDGGPASSTDPAAGTFTITGVYEDPRWVRDDILFEQSVPARTGWNSRYLISVPGGVSWDLVQRLNKVGFAVKSKAVIADPPPDSQVPFYTQYPQVRQGFLTLDSVTATAAAVAVAMVLLEVVLLAGPAFAVSARRRRRDFGLLGAAGADGRRLRRIVLADGVVLGLAGGVAGVVLGVAVGGAVLPWLADYSNQEPGGFRVAPLELAAAAAVGVLTGVVAALAPALATARLDILTALTGRRGQVSAPWKLPLLGLIGVVGGTALLFAGAFSRGSSAVLMILGICLAELGLVACTPVLVAWSGRLARFLPLSGRLALRDGARNRGRTAPAVAAVMAAVAGASAIAVVLASDHSRGRAQYQAEVRNGVATVWLNQSDVDPAQFLAKVGAQIPVRQSGVEGMPSDVNHQVMLALPPGCTPDAPSGGTETSSRACGGYFTPPVEGGPGLVGALIGYRDPTVEAVLAAGGAVVFDASNLATPAPHATVRLVVEPNECMGMGPSATPECKARTQEITVPAALVAQPAQLTPASAIVAPGVLEKYGVKTQPAVAYFDTTRMPTAAEQKKADDVLNGYGIDSPFYVERGYQNSVFIGLLVLAAIATVVTLGAAAVATGLAITDAQGDLETLAAVGARPRVRRSLAGAQAAVIAGLGAVLGATFGIIPAGGLLEARAHGMAHVTEQVTGRIADGSVPSYLTIPWAFLALVVLAPPTLAALGAAGLTRSRIAMTRRRT